MHYISVLNSCQYWSKFACICCQQTSLAIASAITIIADVPAPTQIIITGPNAIFGRLFKTTKNGSATSDKNLEHHKIIAIIIPSIVPDKKPTIVS